MRTDENPVGGDRDAFDPDALMGLDDSFEALPGSASGEDDVDAAIDQADDDDLDGPIAAGPVGRWAADLEDPLWDEACDDREDERELALLHELGIDLGGDDDGEALAVIEAAEVGEDEAADDDLAA